MIVESRWSAASRSVVVASVSAFDRIRVSGVWRLWLTPRRKSSFASDSVRSWLFCEATWANSCASRIATAISVAYRSSSDWSARVHGWVAGRTPTSRPIRSSPARSSARTGTETPGIRSSSGTVAGSRNWTAAEMSPNARSASRAALSPASRHRAQAVLPRRRRGSASAVASAARHLPRAGYGLPRAERGHRHREPAAVRSCRRTTHAPRSRTSRGQARRAPGRSRNPR